MHGRSVGNAYSPLHAFRQNPETPLVVTGRICLDRNLENKPKAVPAELPDVLKRLQCLAHGLDVTDPPSPFFP